MKTSFRKSIAIIVCVCLMLTVCFNSVIAADNGAKVVTNDGTEVKIVKNNANSLTVMTEYNGDDKAYKGAILYATMDKKTNEITMEIVEKAKKKAFGLLPSGKDKVKKYKVKIENPSNNENFSAIVTDVETKKEHKIGRSNDKVTAQIPFVIWGLGAAGMALLKALLVALAIGVTVTAVIVVGDYAYTKAKEISEALRKQKAHKYYRAVISGGQVLIGDPLDYATCYAWVSARGDCFAPVQSDARIMAQAVGGVARGPEIHGPLPNYMWHYQPKYANFYDSHCFF